MVERLLYHNGHEFTQEGLAPVLSRDICHDRHMHAWSSMLRSLKTSTLKFALARAILDEVRETQGNGELLISRERLSFRLVSYYWYQVRQFRLKQAAAEIQEPNVVRQLRSLAEATGTKWDPLRPEIRSVVEFVTEAGFREVLPRFHTGIGGIIFESRRGGIAIPADQRAFINAHEPFLIQVVLAGWAEQVERYNLTPRVLAKVRFDGRRRTSVSKWVQPLRELDNACFYCRKSKPDVAHVDHFIPWSFLFDDAPWNLVLACETCNMQKSDKIPSRQFLTRLCLRNEEEALESTEFGKRIVFSLTQLPYQSLDSALAVLCQQAYLQGFIGDWSPS